MSFSDKLYISGIQIKKPENEDEWTRKLLGILLSDPRGDREINLKNKSQ